MMRPEHLTVLRAWRASKTAHRLAGVGLEKEENE
jgi:hypothetical protein